jgi:hypothetical protein
MGMRVIAVDSGPEKERVCRSLGAEVYEQTLVMSQCQIKESLFSMEQERLRPGELENKFDGGKSLYASIISHMLASSSPRNSSQPRSNMC